MTAPAVRAPATRVPAQRRPATARPARAPLSVVLPTPSRAPRAPFIICICGLLTLGLLSLLLLNTVLAQGAFTVHALQKRTAVLSEEQQRLQSTVALAGSPLVLAERARALGLVQVRDPAFIRTSDGRVLGNPTKARRPAVPKPAVATSPAVKPAASAAPAAGPGAKPAAKPKAKPRPTSAPARTP